MGVLASVNCYTTRVNLSVAIVVMVNSTWIASMSEDQTDDDEHLSPCVKDPPTSDAAASGSHLPQRKFLSLQVSHLSSMPMRETN